MRHLNRQRQRTNLAAALVFASLLGAGDSRAGSISSRDNLHADQGGPGVLEDFESYIFLGSNPSHLEVSIIDDDTVAQGQGPGLVVPGIRISADTEDYQWNPAGYTGSTSQELTASDDPFMTIDFLDPVAAVGIDLRAYTGIAHLALMQVFAANDVTVLGTISAVPLSPTGEPVFFGWSHPAGIGKIVLNQSGNAWSPLIDNLEFYPIPEPAALIQACLVLATLWLARRTLPKRRPQPRPCD